MTDINILMQKRNGDQWDRLFPYTKAKNVFDEEGYSILQTHESLNSMFINVKYPPKGMTPAKLDGITDDYPAIQAIIDAFSGTNQIVKIFIPAGTALLSKGLRLPDNTYLQGAGRDVTILKMMGNVSPNEHGLTNKSNTGDYTTNTGNKNIIVKDLTVDANGSVRGAGNGCAFQFANVTNLILENIHGIKGCLHCIDVSASQYDIGDGSYTPGPSFNVFMNNCMGTDPIGDDAITVHYSWNVVIINPQSYMKTVVPGSTTQGLEIDEGCRNVVVYGGYAKGFTKGLQIKGHDTTPAATRVYVDGFISEGNLYNYDIQHGNHDDETNVSTTAFNVVLKNCTSLTPQKVNNAYPNLRALELRGYSNVLIENFTAIGEHNHTNEGDGNIRVYLGARNCVLRNIFVRDIYHQYGAITVNNNAGNNNRIEHVVALNCEGNVMYVSVDKKITIDDVYAETSYTGTKGIIRCATVALQNNLTSIRNVDGVGYSGAIEDESGTDGVLVPFNADVGTKSYWIRANSSGGTTPGSQEVMTFGWFSGNQNLAAGEGIKIPFKFRVKNGQVFTGGFLEFVKATDADDNTSTDMYIGIRNTDDSGTNARRKLKLSSLGDFSPANDNSQVTGTPSLRWKDVYSASGSINTSDENQKEQIGDIPDEWLDAWADVQYVRFKFKDAVSQKGDQARWHIGVIAQRIYEAFKKHGLDAFEIGLLCYDEWEENGEKKSLWSIRPDECQFMELALMRREMKKWSTMKTDS